MTELKIPSHRIEFSDAQRRQILEDVDGILRSGSVVLGEYTRRFEDEYAEACRREHGVAVASDTAAFEIQLKMLGDRGRRHVLFPALGFPSILESVKNAGFLPYFVDANIEGHLFASAQEIEGAIRRCREDTGEYPAALILMHTGGLLARDGAEIEVICKTAGVVVLEDAAHGFGAELDGVLAGERGHSSAFSLYATKPMHACEGGMIVTDDAAWADEAKVYRNYGRIAEFGRSICTVHGYSWRMTEIQAAIGLSNLGVIDQNIETRRALWKEYDAAIDAVGGIWERVPALPLTKGMLPNGYRYIRLLPEPSAVRRQEMKGFLRDEYGVDLPGEVYELPAHKQPIWAQYEGLSMPVAEWFCASHFALPLYASLFEGDIGYVVEAVTHGLEKFYG